MLGPFEIHQPERIAEAAELRARLGDDAALYAGGTELLLVMKEGLARWRHLIDVKTIPELAELGRRGEALVIGANVTHRRLERSPLLAEGWSLLAEMERQVANVRVRNVGTLGGNLCFGEPHSDPATALLLLEARVVLRGPHGERTLPLESFLVGSYDTALGGDEVLVRVEVPAPPTGAVSAYRKFGFHERPTVGGAVLFVADRALVREARVAVGCLAPTPVRLAALEERLVGVELDALARGFDCRGGGFADLDVVSDLHGSAEYKREIAAVLASRALAALAHRRQSAAA